MRASLPRSTQHTNDPRLRRLRPRVNLPPSRSAPLFFDSGLNTNADFFTYVLQSSDDPFHAEAIPASVNDGARASRVAPRCAVPSCTIRCVHCAMRSGLYGTDGGQKQCVRRHRERGWYGWYRLSTSHDAQCYERRSSLRAGNSHLVIDEVQATCLYTSGSRGMVVLLGLEGRVLVQLYTFNNAPEASGGTCLSSGSLQSLRFSITADASQAHYQEMLSSSFSNISVDTQRSPRVGPPVFRALLRAV